MIQAGRNGGMIIFEVVTWSVNRLLVTSTFFSPNLFKIDASQIRFVYHISTCGVKKSARRKKYTTNCYHTNRLTLHIL